MTKKDYELIAETIANECRATLAVWKITPGRKDLADKLQKAWNISLALSNRFEANDNKFNRSKFLDMCKCSPQNWRHLNGN